MSEKVLSSVSKHGMDDPPGDERLRDAIVYIAHRFAENEESSRGAVKLNKVLWWADFESFRERGRSVTGAVYQKLREGPAPVRLLPAHRGLQAAGIVTIEARELGAEHSETVVIAARPPETSEFDDLDVDYLERALSKFQGMTGTECSEISHRESVGWNAVEYNEVIPYETSILSPAPLSEDALEWARRVAVETGLLSDSGH